jgi:hypothetical protein
LVLENKKGFRIGCVRRRIEKDISGGMPGQGEAKWCGVVKGEEEVRIGV